MPGPNRSPLLPLGAALFGFVASQASADTTLSTVKVEDTRENTAANSYQPQKTRVGKLAQMPKDVPQSLTIVTQKLIEDRQDNTLKDALHSVPGLTFNAGEGGRIGDNMNLRGFYSFGDLYLDGIRDVAQYNREVFNLEQVEVLRGSGSMLFGRGQAGGVINQVSKQAMLANKREITTSVGTQEHQRISTDINQVVGDTTALRLNAMKTDEESTRDYVSSEREGIAPTLRTGIGENDELSLSYYYLNTHNTPDYGLPFFDGEPLDVPTDRFYGTRQDYENNMTKIATGSYLHRFSEQTELRSVLRTARYDRDLWATQPQLRNAGSCTGTPTSISDATCINRSIKARGGQENTYTSQTDFTHRTETFGLNHELLAGAEFLKEDAGRWNYNTTGLTIPTTTVGDSHASAPGLDPRYGNQDRTNINDYNGFSTGLYLQDTIEFLPGWKLLAGARHDELKADYNFKGSSTAPASSNHLNYDEWSYRSGLIFQPSDEATYYIAWNDSFNPTADLYQLDDGRGFEAERSSTREIGAKWDLLDGNLSLRTALYRAVKDWERNTDLNSTGGLLSKQRHTDGIEIEAAGRLTDNWELFAGWTAMDSEIDQPGYNINTTTGVVTPHSPYLEGQRPRNTPPFAYNLWSTYALGGGWKIGAGIEAKGEREAYGINTTAAPIQERTAPRYERVDAMLSYEEKDWAAQLNVKNLLNEEYYDAIYDNGGHVVPGTERTVQLSATLKF